MLSKLGLIRRSRKTQTDYLRWSRQESYRARWTKRSAFAAALCADSLVVCDIGCGMQELRSLLRPGITYLPVDLKKWTEDTLVCDLNQRQLPEAYLQRADSVTMLGVLEYLDDVPWVFESLAQYALRLVVSYNPQDLSDADRSGNGWVNDFSLAEVVRLLHGVGYVVRDVRLIEEGQVIIMAIFEGPTKKPDTDDVV